MIGSAPTLGPAARAEARLRELIVHVPDAPAALVEACRDTRDWRALMASAGRHGLRGVLYRALVQGGAELPDEVRREEEQLRVVERLMRRGQSEVLAGVLRALEAAEVPCVALKGAVLAERLYAPEPWIRPTTDLDVMIREADYARAIEALRPTGYVLAGGAIERVFRERHHHVHLERAGAPTLELHGRAYVGFGTRIASEPLIERASQWVTATGARVGVMSAEDEWVYLAVHAAGHVVRRLGWLYDVKLRGREGVDWAVVRARARAVGVERVVEFMSEQVGRIGGDDGLAKRGRASGGWRAMVLERVRQRAADAPDHGAVGTAANLAFSALLAAGPWATARAVGAKLAWVGESAWRGRWGGA